MKERLPGDRRLWTARQVADFMGVHINTVKRSDLPFYRISSRGDRRYDPRDVRTYMADRWTEGELRAAWGDR